MNSKNINYRDLGMKIKTARRIHGYTQAQMAAESGISAAFLGHIERGSRIPSLETMVRIANVLDLSLDSMLMDSLAAEPTVTGKYGPSINRLAAIVSMLYMEFQSLSQKEQATDEQEED